MLKQRLTSPSSPLSLACTLSPILSPETLINTRALKMLHVSFFPTGHLSFPTLDLHAQFLIHGQFRFTITHLFPITVIVGNMQLVAFEVNSVRKHKALVVSPFRDTFGNDEGRKEGRNLKFLCRNPYRHDVYLHLLFYVRHNSFLMKRKRRIALFPAY